MGTWNPPADATEETRRVIEIDMAFATAVSAVEDMKARFEEEANSPNYVAERDGYDERAATAWQQAINAVDAAFAFFVGNIVMTGLKSAFDSIMNEGFDTIEDTDKLIAIVRAARAVWGTWD